MKKETARILIIIGIALIVLQLLSFTGNAKSGVKIQISAETFLYDMMFLVGYFLVGIVGAALMVVGIIFYNIANNKADRRRKKAARKSIVPADVLAHCELVGNNGQLLAYLQSCVNNGLIEREKVNELFELYKKK